MLIYENEGFIEVESKHIQQLCRSTVAVSLGDTGHESSTLHAVLCDYLDNSEQRCRVAFYSKVLKRSFVFTVKGSTNKTSWQSGQNVLVQLGFQLEAVNLKLSPAMLEVVLQDVPGILSPVEARKQRTEKKSLLAEFQNSYDEAPDSAKGKKAALKLSAEKRLNVQSDELRHVLEELFSLKENASAEFEALVSQVKDLTSRLESAEALAESERSQKEMSESITLAAEKRIQELEEILVDVETKDSKTLKQKQENAQLQARIKELGSELAAAESVVDQERNKQEQFIADVNASLERISLLEKELKETEGSFENIQAQLEEERAEKSQLLKNFQGAELRIKILDSGLKNAEKKVAQCDESAKESEDIQAQLAASQQALKDSVDLNTDLEERLATVHEQNEKLTDNLRLAEKAASDKTQDEEQMTVLSEQNKQLLNELETVREECAQERSIRKRLEKGAVEEEKRIQVLEESLAQMSHNVSERPSTEEMSKGETPELSTLQSDLQELSQQFEVEQKCREELESEINDAHKIIDSLEKMIRETEGAAAEQLSHASSQEKGDTKVHELEEKLRIVQNQLDHERIEQKKLIKAVVVAENKLADQEKVLAQQQAESLGKTVQKTSVEDAVAQSQEKPVKLLPHDLRPAPKKGSLFHPDWDLEGLPCQSSKQVFRAWETVFNVQTSLEGYPSQYCMAFLVVLRLEKKKKLYMLYRLKLSKHTLVCVPTKTLNDEDSLKKHIKEGLKFLKMSGFDMEEMADENIDSTLKSYFLGG